MKSKVFPLLEYDPALPAVIEPVQFVKDINAPWHCVICYFGELVDNLNREGN